MPVLPLIDLLIMVGWTSLMGAALLKAIYVTTTYRPTLVGLGPMEFLLLAVTCLIFALTLAARTWVKYHEPELMARRRRAAYGGEREPSHVGASHAGASRAPAGGTGLATLSEPGRAAKG